MLRSQAYGLTVKYHEKLSKEIIEVIFKDIKHKAEEGFLELFFDFHHTQINNMEPTQSSMIIESIKSTLETNGFYVSIEGEKLIKIDWGIDLENCPLPIKQED